MAACLLLFAGLNTVADHYATHPTAEISAPQIEEPIELPGMCNVPPAADLPTTIAEPLPKQHPLAATQSKENSENLQAAQQH